MKRLIEKLNKTFDNRTRLGIMSILIVNDWVEFKVLKEMLGASDGNLASHIKALEKAEFIEIRKQFVGKKPQTTYRVTNAGRTAFNDHLDALEQILKNRE
jgi:DNA-binding MarR family transcriptional regulator